MPQPIVLVGPRGVKLNAIGQQLAEMSHVPLHSIDDFSDEEWKTFGYDATAEIMATAQGGVYAGYQQLMPMRLRAVEQLLGTVENGILILPAEFVVYDDPILSSRLQMLLDHIADVILLTPSPDAQETERLLDVNLAAFPNWGEVNAYWIRNPSNRRLAKHVVYTQGKTEPQTRDEILRLKSDQEPSEIILIGPKLTGKTTIGCMLANRLGVRQVSLDNLASKYFAQTDYDRNRAVSIFNDEGIYGWLRYRQSYDAFLIEGILRDEHQCVIDFGGGHSVYEDQIQFARVQTALAPYANVFLLLPSPDEAESINILNQRFEADLASEKRLQRLLVTNPIYSLIAKHTLYTKDKTPSAISNEIIALHID